ncbi:unnamed protein product [Effrenium voratum]|nr:unnamed protein product [Effrenium voratum]
MTPEVWDELCHLREDRQKMLDAAEKARQDGDEGGSEFQSMLASEITEKIEEIEGKYGFAPPGKGEVQATATAPAPVPPALLSFSPGMTQIPPGVAGALALRPGMSLAPVLPPGLSAPPTMPTPMAPMGAPMVLPGMGLRPPSLTQQQAMAYEQTKAASTALEPEVIELVHYFKIGERHARMLNEQLKRRNNTYEEDIAALYDILKGAKNPADLLMVSIRWMEQGVFRGCLTPNPKVEKIAKKYKLDAPSACKLAEALENREDADEALDKFCEHLAASNKPSSLVMIMLKDLKTGAVIPPCTKTPAIGSYLHKKERPKRAGTGPLVAASASESAVSSRGATGLQGTAEVLEEAPGAGVAGVATETELRIRASGRREAREAEIEKEAAKLETAASSLLGTCCRMRF